MQPKSKVANVEGENVEMVAGYRSQSKSQRSTAARGGVRVSGMNEQIDGKRKRAEYARLVNGPGKRPAAEGGKLVVCGEVWPVCCEVPPCAHPCS